MEQEKRVDGFRFLPPALKAWVKSFIPDEDFKEYIPWKPMNKPFKSIDACSGDQRWDQFKDRSSF